MKTTLAGGPYEKNTRLIDKVRDLAGLQARGGFHKLNSEVRRLQDSEEYGVPHRKRPSYRKEHPVPANPEQEVSPTITGLHNEKKRRKQRMIAHTSSGRGFGGFATQTSVGAHRT